MPRATIRPGVDWEGVEREYRAGLRTLRDIAAEFGCTEGGIRAKARVEGWERDLSGKITAKAEALVRKQELRNEKRKTGLAGEKQLVEAVAVSQASAIMCQRKDVARARSVVQKLFAELEALMDNLGDFQDMASILASGDEGKMEDALRKVAALPVKTDVAKKLAESLRVLVELERKVLRISDAPGSGDSPTVADVAKMSAAEAYRHMLGGSA